MKNRSTPGPWDIRTLENFGYNVVHYNGGYKFDIVRVAKVGDEANARLIAAAPDMLEALRIARAAIVSLEWAHFNEIAGPGDTFDAWLSDNEALPVIDAAIARATGEKP